MDYLSIFITKLQIFYFFHCEKIVTFIAKKEKKVKSKYKIVK